MRNFSKFINLHQFTKSCSPAIELPFAHLRPLSCQRAAVDPSAAVRLPLGRRWALALYLCSGVVKTPTGRSLVYPVPFPSFIHISCNHGPRRLNIPSTAPTDRCCSEHNKNYELSTNKTKSLVESLKLTANMFVEVNNDLVQIILLFENHKTVCFELWQFEVIDPFQELGTPGHFRFENENSFEEWTNLLNVRQLIDHLKLVCHSSVTTLKFGPHVEKFTLESVYKTVKGIESISLTYGNHEHNRRILSLFQTPSIDLGILALVNRRVPRDILIQNWDVIRASSVQIPMDELLTTNSQGILMWCRGLSVKTLNRFLKLWTKGSNPRLEWLHLRFPGNFQNEELFSGLKAECAPRNKEKYFKSCGDKELKKVVGGWDIWRFDGTKATITVLKNVGLVNFQLFVWHDHCMVN
ncbi:hypothetical protein CAEBREN_01129 [Caenorhabditis brenneri]|uniref:Sdz-33 F-box domain-containing protein n=1 Tax=Caenorhabditis brenneri TaxID=135651 RepID=G0N0J8_CAEBE|nr:hypothetical protein CAEBREN_01129 [Caenorhabditis brenneri]